LLIHRISFQIIRLLKTNTQGLGGTDIVLKKGCFGFLNKWSFIAIDGSIFFLTAHDAGNQKYRKVAWAAMEDS